MLEAPLVEDDDAEYSDAQIKEVLLMLDDGNKSTANKGQGLVQVASAFGIVGRSPFNAIVGTGEKDERDNTPVLFYFTGPARTRPISGGLLSDIDHKTKAVSSVI